MKHLEPYMTINFAKTSDSIIPSIIENTINDVFKEFSKIGVLPNYHILESLGFYNPSNNLEEIRLRTIQVNEATYQLSPQNIHDCNVISSYCANDICNHIWMYQLLTCYKNINTQTKSCNIHLRLTNTIYPPSQQLWWLLVKRNDIIHQFTTMYLKYNPWEQDDDWWYSRWLEEDLI